MHVGKVASHAYALQRRVGVDRAVKCPAQNPVSQKHTRFRRLTRNQKPVEVNVKKMHSRIYKSITSQ